MPASAARLASADAPPAYSSAGEMLRIARVKQRLTMRQVVIASKCLALQLDNEEFAISLGHMSEIERRDIAPNIYRLYSLATIYKLDLLQLLIWFGIPMVAPSSQCGSIAKTPAAVFAFPNNG
jgi:transcriptional regulator with XRE-family HTH domain